MRLLSSPWILSSTSQALALLPLTLEIQRRSDCFVLLPVLIPRRSSQTTRLARFHSLQAARRRRTHTSLMLQRTSATTDVCSCVLVYPCSLICSCHVVCHVFDCAAVADDVLATLGQVFTLINVCSLHCLCCISVDDGCTERWCPPRHRASCCPPTATSFKPPDIPGAASRSCLARCRPQDCTAPQTWIR